jgi:gamma-glutamylcyclotransferase (GGCT)/AIG2-like uncharacterized protein YtfP
MMDRLFVYGTLRRRGRGSRFTLLGPGARLIGLARMRGRLVDLGDYPGLVPPKNPEDWVRGEVYALPEPADTLRRLDEYEGCADPVASSAGFRRIMAEAELDSGRMTRAWVYLYEGKSHRARFIASGDFLRPDSPS